jgi:Short C-terminal domain
MNERNNEEPRGILGRLGESWRLFRESLRDEYEAQKTPETPQEEAPIFTAQGGWNVLYLFGHEVELRNMGVTGSNVQSIRYDQITQVAVKRGGMAALIIESRGGGTLTLKRATHSTAEEARRIIQERVNAALDASPPRHAEREGSAPADIPDQILKLSKLRDSGAITVEDFEAKKKDLLDRM